MYTRLRLRVLYHTCTLWYGRKLRTYVYFSNNPGTCSIEAGCLHLCTFLQPTYLQCQLMRSWQNFRRTPWLVRVFQSRASRPQYEPQVVGCNICLCIYVHGHALFIETDMSQLRRLVRLTRPTRFGCKGVGG